MTKYLVKSYMRDIQAVEVEGETPHFVCLPNSRKEAKRGEYGSYFDTWEEAYKFLHDRVSQELSCAHSNVIRRQAELEAVEKLKQ